VASATDEVVFTIAVLSIMDSNDDNLNSRAEAQVQAAAARFGPRLAVGLYLLLVASAVLALGSRRFPGAFPPPLEVIAPTLFLVFLVCFAVYRLVLVRVRKYPASKAFFQIGAAALFLTLLLPEAKSRYDAPVDDLEALMTDGDPRVRALTAELMGYRADGGSHAPSLIKALRDDDERVREQAHRSLVRLAGEDLGPGQTESSRQAWERRFHE
jgi:hypothetical protein